MNIQTSQLQAMLERAFIREQHTRFVGLARRAIKRLRKESTASIKERKLAIFKLIGQLPEIKQRQRLAAKQKGKP